MTQPTHLCLYDADCGFCGLCVRLGQRLDRRGRIEFVSNSERSRWPRGVTEQLLGQTIVVEVDGDRYVRARAVAALLAALPGLFLLSWVLRLPLISWGFDVAYRAVSRNRMRISGWLGLGVCGVPRSAGPASPLSPAAPPSPAGPASPPDPTGPAASSGGSMPRGPQAQSGGPV